jgi:hypothetical protein
VIDSLSLSEDPDYSTSRGTSTQPHRRLGSRGFELWESVQAAGGGVVSWLSELHLPLVQYTVDGIEAVIACALSINADMIGRQNALIRVLQIYQSQDS